MATTNDITGDRLVNTPKAGARQGRAQERKFQLDMPEFKVYQCSNCFIKVSTSNGKCPLCGSQLAK